MERDWLSDVDERVPTSLCVFISREDSGFAQCRRPSRLHDGLGSAGQVECAVRALLLAQAVAERKDPN